jgi:hypothetical protein
MSILDFPISIFKEGVKYHISDQGIDWNIREWKEDEIVKQCVGFRRACNDRT